MERAEENERSPAAEALVYQDETVQRQEKGKEQAHLRLA